MDSVNSHAPKTATTLSRDAVSPPKTVNSHFRHRSLSALSSLSKHQSTKTVENFYQKQNLLLKKYESDAKISNDKQKPLHSLSDKADIDYIDNDAPEGLTPTIFRLALSPRVKVIKRKESSQSILSDTDTSKLMLIMFLINLILSLIKLVAFFKSNSLSILASFLDSVVDVTAQTTIYLTARVIQKRDPYLYPRGMTRLEPLAIIVVSVVMAVASVQMIIKSLRSIVFVMEPTPILDASTIILVGATILIKLVLFLVSNWSSHLSMSTFAPDHRNNFIVNFFSLIFAYSSTTVCPYVDPLGAILISLYMTVFWISVGKQQLTIISGIAADPDFINRIIRLCIHHDEDIHAVDSVYVYHFGSKFLIEAHIVLDPETKLKRAHDLAERLQVILESLDEVERAFVHCDYQYDLKNDCYC